MDPVIHLSEGHRSDMLLDLSGLTRKERVMVQASSTNERDFDRVAGALIIQHPRIHLQDKVRNARKGKGKDGFKTRRQFERSSVSAEGAKGKNTLAVENLGKSDASAHYASCTPVEDYNYD